MRQVPFEGAWKGKIMYHGYKLRGLRGKHYINALLTIEAESGDSMNTEFDRIKKETGKVTLCNIGQIAVKYGLNIKATIEWFEHTGRIRFGMYDSLKNRGLKAMDIYKAVGARIREV